MEKRPEKIFYGGDTISTLMSPFGNKSLDVIVVRMLMP
jgi:hypothetical protein